MEQTARQRGQAWHNCRLVLRIYDVSYIQFTGLNAHRIQDETLPGLCGQRSLICLVRELSARRGRLRPAQRRVHPRYTLENRAVRRDTGSPNRDQTALYVDERWRIERVGNVWEQENFLRRRNRPKMRHPLRIASFAFAQDGDGMPAPFVRELAIHQRALGHDVHVFVPAGHALTERREMDGVSYHPLPVHVNGSPLEAAQAFARAAEEYLLGAPDFDLLHHHEWLTGLAASRVRRPRILSLTSLEATRRNGTPPSAMSRAIQEAERTMARSASCVLTPDWLRERAITELGMDGVRVRAFPMEGRLANEWECPLDYGHVKGEIGVGPLDRLILYVGPLEYFAGVDLLVESMPVLLRRGQSAVGLHRLRRHARPSPASGPSTRRGPRRAACSAIGKGRRSGAWRAPPRRSCCPRAAACRSMTPWSIWAKAGRPVVTTHGGPRI